jgi:hypothetical protein
MQQTRFFVSRIAFAVLAWALSIFSAYAQLSFTATNYSLAGPSSGAVPVAAADIYGAGKLELICPIYGFACQGPGANDNGSGHTLLVLTNNGNGRFGSNVTFTVDTGPTAVVAADLYHRGRVDLISSGNTASTLTVLTNTSSGGFALCATLPTGKSPQMVVPADLNGDGYLDLICPNNGTNTLTVWFNNGAGGFGSNATLTVGNKPYSVAAADIRGAGELDLICANLADNKLTVLTNNGHGGFGSNATINVGNMPLWVAAADVRGIGKTDLICANYLDDSYMVLTNNGSGGFGLSATLVNSFLPAGFVAASFVAGDLNGDGYVDLACGTSGPGCSGGDNYLVVWTNNTHGSFAHGATLLAGNKTNPTVADLNADGKLDVTVANYLDGTVTVFLNTTPFPAAGTRPTLACQRLGTTVRVSWPSASPGWSLQETVGLVGANWLPSGYDGYVVTDDGTHKSLSLPAGRQTFFFRLTHP